MGRSDVDSCGLLVGTFAATHAAGWIVRARVVAGALIQGSDSACIIAAATGTINSQGVDQEASF